MEETFDNLREEMGPTDKELLIMLERAPINFKSDLMSQFKTDPWIRRQLIILYNAVERLYNLPPNRKQDKVNQQLIQSFWKSFQRDWIHRQDLPDGLRK